MKSKDTQSSSFSRSPKNYSVFDAAKVLGISERSGWKLIYERELAHMKSGRRTLIPEAAIEEYISRHTIPAQ